jgi:serine/threonine-protein kinase
MLLNNRYQVLQILGRGGFGETFLTVDLQMPSQRRCVIKQLKPVTTNPEIYQLIQERFAREAVVLEKLGEHCSQIPRLYAYFTENNQLYLVQELIEGITLTAKVRKFGSPSESEVREILISLLSVLDYVHSQGIVHRDIKPDNIILRHSDGKPVLIDFGAVRETVATELSSQGQITSSIVMGTPGFMPSEQGIGRPVYASDLYSLGLTAIYLLTGKMPQELSNDRTTGEIIWHREAVSLSLAEVLDKAVRSHHQDRFPTAKAMVDALQNGFVRLPDNELTLPPTQQSEKYTSTVQAPQKYQYVLPHRLAPTQSKVALQTSTKRDWQKPAIIGGIIGVSIVGGLAFTKIVTIPNIFTVTTSPQSRQQAITNFVTAYIKSSENTDIDRALSFFAPTVNYYQYGEVDRNFIEKKLLDYYQRWPVRQYSPLPPFKVEEISNNVIRVVADTDVNLRSSKKPYESKISIELLIKEDYPGKFAIVKVREQIR